MEENIAAKMSDAKSSEVETCSSMSNKAESLESQENKNKVFTVVTRSKNRKSVNLEIEHPVRKDEKTNKRDSKKKPLNCAKSTPKVPQKKAEDFKQTHKKHDDIQNHKCFLPAPIPKSNAWQVKSELVLPINRFSTEAFRSPILKDDILTTLDVHVNVEFPTNSGHFLDTQIDVPNTQIDDSFLELVEQLSNEHLTDTALIESTQPNTSKAVHTVYPSTSDQFHEANVFQQQMQEAAESTGAKPKIKLKNTGAKPKNKTTNFDSFPTLDDTASIKFKKTKTPSYCQLPEESKLSRSDEQTWTPSEAGLNQSKKKKSSRRRQQRGTRPTVDNEIDTANCYSDFGPIELLNIYDPYIYDLMNRVRLQIEFYFQENNLINNLFFQRHMDCNGYVPLSVIASFSRMPELTSNFNLIMASLTNSDKVETHPSDFKIRSKINSTYWSPINLNPEAADFVPRQSQK